MRANACETTQLVGRGYWLLAEYFFLLMAFAWIAYVVLIFRSRPSDALPWLPYALGGFMLALGPICWLIAWRVGDWKIEAIE